MVVVLQLNVFVRIVKGGGDVAGDVDGGAGVFLVNPD